MKNTILSWQETQAWRISICGHLQSKGYLSAKNAHSESLLCYNFVIRYDEEGADVDPMVSARVPLALRDAVNQGLREIGSSPTELINSAYEYFLANRSLPRKTAKSEAGRRSLSEKDYEQLAKSIAESSHPIPESFFGELSYDELLARNLRSSYEALA